VPNSVGDMIETVATEPLKAEGDQGKASRHWCGPSRHHYTARPRGCHLEKCHEIFTRAEPLVF
jgi:hypothetical protein